MRQNPMGTVSLSKDQCTLGKHRKLLGLLSLHAHSSLIILRTLLAVLVSFFQLCTVHISSFLETPSSSWRFSISLAWNSSGGWTVHFFGLTPLHQLRTWTQAAAGMQQLLVASLICCWLIFLLFLLFGGPTTDKSHTWLILSCECPALVWLDSSQLFLS